MKLMCKPVNTFKTEICVDCGSLCSFGTGRYVNRYPVYNDEVEGWRCGFCAEEIDSLIEEMNNDV